MKISIDVDRLTEIIKYLEKKPEIVCDPTPQYDSGIWAILDSLETDPDYSDNYDALEGKPIGSMSLENLKTMFTFISRGERFCDGHIASFVEDGTLLELAKRELELLK